MRRDREFDWNAWLMDWQREAKLTIGTMLVRFGIAGSQKFADYLRKRAVEAGRPLPERVLSPLPSSGTLDIDAVDRLLLPDARERLAELSQYVEKLTHEYAWQFIKNGGSAYLPVQAAELQSAQARLGVQLPSTYAAFLRVSNGWLTVTNRLLGVQQIEPFGVKDPVYVRDWYGIDTLSDREYFVYGKDQDSARIRSRYLPDCLLISESVLWPNDRLLLNPSVRFDDGEWEAWFMAPSLAGANRYQSFVELMEAMREDDVRYWRQFTGEA